MKNPIITVILVALTGYASAQHIDAEDIMRKAKNGEDVRYENVIIRGVVDLTPYYEEQDDLSDQGWFSFRDNKIESTLRGKLTFINCEFEDDLLAYYHDDQSAHTFVSHFDLDVIFKDCTFKGDVAFKYSEFGESVDFSNVTFRGNANFKYAEFKDESTFEKATFEADTDFKYAEFDEKVNFANTTFKEEANFKYAEMEDGVHFTNTTFDGFWNIKHAEMSRDVNLKGIQVNGDLDSKYTKVNGKSFNHYLLSGN